VTRGSENKSASLQKKREGEEGRRRGERKDSTLEEEGKKVRKTVRESIKYRRGVIWGGEERGIRWAVGRR